MNTEEEMYQLIKELVHKKLVHFQMRRRLAIICFGIDLFLFVLLLLFALK